MFVELIESILSMPDCSLIVREQSVVSSIGCWQRVRVCWCQGRCRGSLEWLRRQRYRRSSCLMFRPHGRQLELLESDRFNLMVSSALFDDCLSRRVEECREVERRVEMAALQAARWRLQRLIVVGVVVLLLELLSIERGIGTTCTTCTLQRKGNVEFNVRERRERER